MDTYFSPYFLDKVAFSDYKTQRLMLSLAVDKKKITKDEAKPLIANMFDRLIAIEHNAWVNVENSNRAQQQRENAAYGAALQSFGNSMQQKYTPSQQINCSTVYNAVGASTICR
ncbi:MAG: hypothetical protein ACOYNL_05605 [Rickettsiales bacterium]